MYFCFRPTQKLPAVAPVSTRWCATSIMLKFRQNQMHIHNAEISQNQMHIHNAEISPESNAHS
jgi:hypothetical protein